MLECSTQMLVQLIGIMPQVIGVYLLFDLIGSLFLERGSYMKKMLYGGILALLFNYCIGSTYIIYKGVFKNAK